MSARQIRPALVIAEIERRCDELESQRVRAVAATHEALRKFQETPHLFTRKPDPQAVNASYEYMIAREEDHYSTVTIMRVGKKWYLAYKGKQNTGAFRTRTEAVNWFLKGGR